MSKEIKRNTEQTKKSVFLTTALICVMLAIFACNRNPQEKFFKDTTKGKCSKIEKYTINGVNLNLSTAEGKTGFHLAAAAEHDDCLRALLDHSLDTEIKDAQGNTPIFSAVEAERVDNLQILIDKKVNLKHQNNSGESLFLYA